MVALVTGASRGIGKAIVLELARLGYDLAIVGRNRESLEKVAEEASGVRVLPIEADLAMVESAGAIVDQTVRAFGGIDVLINCAGIPQKGPFTEVTPEQWDAVFAVNARAPFFLCQAALPYLKQSQKCSSIRRISWRRRRIDYFLSSRRMMPSGRKKRCQRGAPGVQGWIIY